MQYFKNAGMKDPIKELSFFISHGLKYLGINYLYQTKMEALVSIL